MMKKILNLLGIGFLVLSFLLVTVSATNSFPGYPGLINSQSSLNSVNPFWNPNPSAISLCVRRFANSYGNYGAFEIWYKATYGAEAGSLYATYVSAGCGLRP